MMRLQHIEIAGFKSFAKKSKLSFDTAVTAVVGPNGSGKSNVVEAFRFVLGEQSMKSMRSKSGADLIFRGSGSVAKLSRAAVSITFDNTDHVFELQPGDGKSPVLFDAITFTRELFADGTSRYLMNGSEIRLKAMTELLASVNIGASSHHIISQGEADSVLRASPRDRREILEDALGLCVYHVRIRESENKLGKALDTLKEVQSLRRELVPHLNFLKKQVEKIEKGRAIREELEALLIQYLAWERATLAEEEQRSQSETSTARDTQQVLQDRLEALPVDTILDTQPALLSQLRTSLAAMRDKRRTIETRMSRLEGILEVERRMVARTIPRLPETHTIVFAPTEYHQLLSDLEFFITETKAANTIEAMKVAIARIEPLIARMKEREPHTVVSEETSEGVTQNDNSLQETVREMELIEQELTAIVAEETHMQSAVSDMEAAREASLAQAQASTKERYEVQALLAQCDAKLEILAAAQQLFTERTAHFDEELREAGFLFGASFVRTLAEAIPVPDMDVGSVRRNIDRLKIRLEEHSGIGNDVVTEYESTVERDTFLARELTDTEDSVRNLETLIMDLKKVLDDKFTTGVKIINERFGEFFTAMFGGGSAFLSITIEKKRKRKGDEELDESDDDTDERFMERGIEVHVNLPSKKVKELNMLSGGERSLVSIALLFAISQVNPPPFLVLDETDAALDESNSRKYGDMVERLAAYSQLIVVTHNRETMSRASVLYGVTLGSDGGSKLLSIKFDEAVKVAK